MLGRLKQLIWILPLVIAGLVAVLGWGQRPVARHHRGRVEGAIDRDAYANVTALGIWSTNQTRLATSLAEDPSLRKLAADIFQLTPPERRIGRRLRRRRNFRGSTPNSAPDWHNWAMRPRNW